MSILSRVRRFLGISERWTAPTRRVMRDPALEVSVNRLGGTYTQLGYRSATVAISEGRTATAGSGDYHARFHRRELLNQSREFYRDNGIYSGMIDRAVSYIVGNGFTLQAKTSDPQWNKKAEGVWKAWARDPEIRGLMDFSGVETMVCREVLLCGDNATLKIGSEQRLQILEAEQITGAGLSDDGLVKDQYGRPKEFLVAPYKNGSLQPAAAARYQPNQLAFVAWLERPSSTRGVPPCQRTFSMLHRINDVCDSEAIAWQLLSRLAVSITRQGGMAQAFGESKVNPAVEGDEEGKLSVRLTELANALIFHGDPGDEVKGIERNLPGKDFTQSITTFLRLLGLPLGLPLEIIMLDWTKSNYSQSRAVLEQAFVSFLKWQNLLARFFHDDIYRWVIGRAVASGALEAHPDWDAHDWIKPTFPWIDAMAEAQAWGAKLDRSMSTHAHALKSLNLDPDEILDSREREIRSAIKRSKAIKAETGVDVDWRIFAGLTASVNQPPMPEESATTESPGPEPVEQEAAE